MSGLDAVVAKLAVNLLPYKDFVAQSEPYIGIFQIIAPALTLNSIRKAKQPTKIPIIPFILLTTFVTLNVFYGQIRRDEAFVNANLIGLSIAVIYLTTYVFLTTNFRENILAIASGFSFIGLVYFYIQREDSSQLEQRFTNLMTSVLCSFHLVAFLGVVKAFVERHSGHFPIEMTVSGLLMAANRLTLGILAQNNFVVVQFLSFFLINLLQILCCLIFPRGDVKEMKTQRIEKKVKSTKKSKRE